MIEEYINGVRALRKPDEEIWVSLCALKGFRNTDKIQISSWGRLKVNNSIVDYFCEDGRLTSSNESIKSLLSSFDLQELMYSSFFPKTKHTTVPKQFTGFKSVNISNPFLLSNLYRVDEKVDSDVYTNCCNLLEGVVYRNEFNTASKEIKQEVVDNTPEIPEEAMPVFNLETANETPDYNKPNETYVKSVNNSEPETENKSNSFCVKKSNDFEFEIEDKPSELVKNIVDGGIYLGSGIIDYLMPFSKTFKTAKIIATSALRGMCGSDADNYLNKPYDSNTFVIPREINGSFQYDFYDCPDKYILVNFNICNIGSVNDCSSIVDIMIWHDVLEAYITDTWHPCTPNEKIINVLNQNNYNSGIVCFALPKNRTECPNKQFVLMHILSAIANFLDECANFNISGDMFTSSQDTDFGIKVNDVIIGKVRGLYALNEALGVLRSFAPDCVEVFKNPSHLGYNLIHNVLISKFISHFMRYQTPTVFVQISDELTAYEVPTFDYCMVADFHKNLSVVGKDFEDFKESNFKVVRDSNLLQIHVDVIFPGTQEYFGKEITFKSLTECIDAFGLRLVLAAIKNNDCSEIKLTYHEGLEVIF